MNRDEKSRDPLTAADYGELGEWLLLMAAIVAIVVLLVAVAETIEAGGSFGDPAVGRPILRAAPSGGTSPAPVARLLSESV